MHATFRPFKHRLNKKNIFGAAVAAVWFTAGLFTIIVLSRIQFNIIWNHVEAGAYSTFVLCCPFIILVSYTSIAIKFYCGTYPQHHGAIIRERKLTKTLFIVTVVSFTLLLPFLIANFLLHVSSGESSREKKFSSNTVAFTVFSNLLIVRELFHKSIAICI